LVGGGAYSFFSRSHFITDQVVASVINVFAVSTSGSLFILDLIEQNSQEDRGSCQQDSEAIVKVSEESVS